MGVICKSLSKQSINGFECLAAVDRGDGIIAAFPSSVHPVALREACPEITRLRQAGRGLLANLPAPTGLVAGADETALFAGKNVVVAFRNGEMAGAAADWARYHCNHVGADAALILDRDPPGGGFATELDAQNLVIPTVVVNADSPLGQKGAPDARHHALAPASPDRSEVKIDPWHAPLGEAVVHELLRHKFLSRARAVAFLDVGDFCLPGDDGSPFDQAVAAPGQIVLMQGVETYPWRLRQGRPAPFGDHISVRRDEKRWLISWCAAPETLAEDAIWLASRPIGAHAAEGRPIAFRRAMGVTFPGVPVSKLVRKSDLVEDPVLVELTQSRFGSKPIRLPQPCKIAPRPVSSVVTVISAMKNEGPFLLDWIAHNRAIGVDHHLVYTNDCDDGTDKLLALLAEAGVAHRDNPYRASGQVPQFAAFGAAQSEEVVGKSDWILTLDVDEYINIHVGAGTIDDLLDAVPAAHVISMPWRLFGNADLHRFHDDPVTRQHTLAAPGFAPRPLQAWAFKSLFRNAGLFRRLGVHRPNGIEAEIQGQLNWVDGSGRLMSPSVWRKAWRMSKANWGYDLVSLNHYAVRNAESFLVKRDRGRVNHTTREQGLAYWFRMNQNAEEDNSIQRLAARVAAEKAKLLALPGVASAHAEAVAWHKARIAALLTQPEMADFYAAITGPRMEKLSRMATHFGANVYLEGPDVIPDDIVDRDPATGFFFTVDRSKT